jgi:uncharacterized membrane protein
MEIAAKILMALSLLIAASAIFRRIMKTRSLGRNSFDNYELEAGHGIALRTEILWAVSYAFIIIHIFVNSRVPT